MPPAPLPPELLAADGPLVAHIRATWPHTLAVYAFGSQIQGTAGPESDLDLGVLVAGYADPLQLWDERFALETLAGLPVDLLDLRAASTVMQCQVINTGRLLWGQQPDAALFECFVMREKYDLDIRRRAQMEDILREGTVYGR